MERVQTLVHKGQEVVIVDLSHSAPEETLKTLPVAAELVRSKPPKSQLILTDVSDATYNKAVADGIKEFVQGNSPYVKASAVVGADGVRLVLLQTVIFLSRRDLRAFPSREEALTFLTSK